MPGYNGPQYQNMCSYEPIEKCRENLAWALKLFGGSASDCEIKNERESCHWEKKQGIQCHYQIHWYTYIGWRAYMYCTGCIASDPAYEAGEVTI